MMESQDQHEAQTSSEGNDTLSVGDGLMHNDTENQPSARRSYFRHQSLVLWSLCALCFLGLVVAIAVAAVNSGAMVEGLDHGPLPRGEEKMHGPFGPFPTEAPLIHSSFDQPSIAVGDPVGDKPSIVADDTDGSYAWAGTASVSDVHVEHHPAPSVAAGDTTGNKPSIVAEGTSETGSYSWSTVDTASTLADFTEEAMNNPFSPQAQALAWLVEHPKLSSMEDWRMKQVFAMATFYYSYSGANWSEGERKNWLSYDVHECQWGSSGSFADHKNECKESRLNVLRLEYQGDNVKGNTPEELHLLSSLESFEIFNMKLRTDLNFVLRSKLSSLPLLDRVRLSDNELKGSMPAYLGDFVKLTSLNLRTNHITGTLPTQLGLLTKLKYLTLYSNKLSGTVPTELARMTNLVSLSLYGNNLKGSLPAALCGLTSLDKLQVDCRQTACPMECDCTCKDPVKQIRGTPTPTFAPRPAGNALTQFPTIAPRDGILLGLQQHSLDALEEFSAPQFHAYAWLLNHPHIDTMPEWRKEQLFGITAFYFAFAGSADWSWTSSERNLWLDYDKHECDWGIGLCDFDNRFLEVTLEDAENVDAESGNGIPAELGMLSILEDIEMYGLGLKADMGTMLPIEQLEYLPLITINLQGNRLFGSIPTEIASLRRLRNLSLARNNLSGKVPTEFGLLQDLKHLTLHENLKLTGPVPSQLGQLSRLETLWLHRTGMTGTLPAEICNLHSLQTLRVDCGKVNCPSRCSEICQCVPA